MEVTAREPAQEDLCRERLKHQANEKCKSILRWIWGSAASSASEPEDERGNITSAANTRG
jgi:hypothetical protein